MSEKNGGPACPVVYRTYVNGSEGVVEGHPGMTLRDYFAAAALTGLTSQMMFRSCTAEEEKAYVPIAATKAYALADALLKARTQGES